METMLEKVHLRWTRAVDKSMLQQVIPGETGALLGAGISLRHCSIWVSPSWSRGKVKAVGRLMGIYWIMWDLSMM